MKIPKLIIVFVLVFQLAFSQDSIRVNLDCTVIGDLKYINSVNNYAKTIPKETRVNIELLKIKNYYISIGDFAAIYINDTHPSVEERVKKIGPALSFPDSNFIRLFSSVSTYMAWGHYYNLNYTEAHRLVRRNIDNNAAIESDFLLSAMITITKEDTHEFNSKALDLLEKGRLINVFPSYAIYKYESILYYRLNQKSKTIQALDFYLKYLESEEKETLPLSNIEKYNKYISFLENEMYWVKSMKYRLR